MSAARKNDRVKNRLEQECDGVGADSLEQLCLRYQDGMLQQRLSLSLVYKTAFCGSDLKEHSNRLSVQDYSLFPPFNPSLSCNVNKADCPTSNEPKTSGAFRERSATESRPSATAFSLPEPKNPLVEDRFRILGQPIHLVHRTQPRRLEDLGVKHDHGRDVCDPVLYNNRLFFLMHGKRQDITNKGERKTAAQKRDQG